MLNRMKHMVLFLLAACMLFACAAGAAESMHQEIENEDFDIEVNVGYNGMMTYGKAMPVRVRIRNFGGDFEGVLGINAYISSKEYDRYEKEISLPAGSQREFEMTVTVFARQDTFTAEILKDGEVICAAGGRPKTVVNPSAMLVGVLSARPQNLNNLNIDRDNDTLARYELWQTIPLTKESFPEETDTLKSFGLLVIDDVDPASLSEKQREALDGWLRSGRIVICGGGANAGRNAAFFSAYTGLKLENVSTSDSVIRSLEELIGRKASGKQASTAVAEYSGAEPLVRDAEGRGLIYSSRAGAGRIYTAAFETGDPKLNSENLMHYFWQQLLVDQDQELYSAVFYANSGNDYYSSANVSSYLPVPAKSLLLPGMLIVAGMLALASILWWVLKKKDLRQWMWLVLPLTAALAAVSLMLLASGSETNRPMAVIADNLVQDASGTIRNYSGLTVASPSFGRHSYSMAGERLNVVLYDYVDYDTEEEEKKNPEPDTLRTCYTVGGANTVTTESVEPWQMVNLATEANARIRGKVSGTVWMEEDGLHGEIVNETDVKLSAGHLITTYGFVSAPALAPGEKAEVLMKKDKFAAGKDPVYKDGYLYPESPGMYSVIDAAVGYSDDATASSSREIQEKAAASSLINSAADQLRRSQGNMSYGSYESALFIYCARPEQMETAELTVDGTPVDKTAHTALLTAELSYTAVGRTGVVFRSAGMDVPVRVETDENMMPTGTVLQSGKYSYFYTLSDTPTFLFTLDGLDNVRIDSLQVILSSYYSNQAAVYALNVRKQAWEEIELNKNIPNPSNYLDGQGRLYLQFRNNGQDMYADISTPLINLEGRLEHAED